MSDHRDYQKEYELLRDQKANESTQATEEKLAKIKKQGPGSVVQLSGLVSEVNINGNLFLILFNFLLLIQLSVGRDIADVYHSSLASHNESSEEEGEEDEFARGDEDDDKQMNFNEYVEQRRESQSEKATVKK